MLFKKLFCFYAVGCLSVGSATAVYGQAKQDSNTVKNLLDSALALESSNKQTALNCYQTAITVSKKINYALGEAKSLHNSGLVQYDLAQYEAARRFFNSAISRYRTIRNGKGMSSCYSNIGNCYQLQDKFDSALIYYQKAIDVSQQYGLTESAGRGYNNMGMVFRKLKQSQKAYDYYSKAFQLAQKSKDSLNMGIALINQGTILDDLGKKEEFYKKQLQALKLGELSNNNYLMKLTSFNIGEYFCLKKDYKSAIQYGEKSLEYSLKLGIPYETERIKPILARFYFLNGDYAKAKSILLESLKQSKKIDASDITLDAYSILQELYEAKGDYKQAYKYQSLAKQLNDKIFNETQVKAIHELEVRYHTSQKDKQLANNNLQLAQKDLQIQRKNSWIIITVSAIGLLLTIVLIIYQTYINKQKLHQQKLIALAKEKEVQVLEAMINGEEKERTRIAKDLHDGVGGMLSAAKMHFSVFKTDNPQMVNLSGFDKALGLLDESANEVRKTAHNLMPELLITHGLKDALSFFCQRISTPITTVEFVSIGGVPRFKQSFELSVYRIVQELMNNVIKHSEAKEAIVQISCHDDLLAITVEDDGKGFNHNGAGKNGIGLSSLHSRVESFNGSMKIDSEEKRGTTIYLEFDIAKLKVLAGSELV
ncbi:tetratricopeptide repeat-containing sensor histidine kinase [Solitalea lacus]|uniref:tetratricopeptide repeat-containing sensor histidine kinase n=1 Tax=Solitalea lacus TaxID=2911172 RepID=UPI001EDC7E52|nr:tetratricopeptide repeat protein [Solitalea lacus]UKJ08522.1 sensor histidine kinase [Solitalea lacus]